MGVEGNCSDHAELMRRSLPSACQVSEWRGSSLFTFWSHLSHPPPTLVQVQQAQKNPRPLNRTPTLATVQLLFIKTGSFAELFLWPWAHTERSGFQQEVWRVSFLMKSRHLWCSFGWDQWGPSCTAVRWHCPRPRTTTPTPPSPITTWASAAQARLLAFELDSTEPIHCFTFKI